MQQQLQWQNQKMSRLDQSTTQLVAKQTGASSDLNPSFSENVGSDQAKHHYKDQ